MAEDGGADDLEELRLENPELADDLERARYHVISRHRRSQGNEELLADDYEWLYSFEYQGQRLSASQIQAIVELAHDGFRNPSRMLTSNRINNAPVVVAALHEATRNIANRFQISAAKVGRELASVLNSNITDFIDVEPGTNRVSLKDLGKLPKEKTAAIQEVHEIRSAQGVQVRIKLYDKMVAVNMASRIMDLFPSEKIKVEVTGLEERLAAALQRVEKEAIEGEIVRELLIEDNSNLP